MMKKLCTVFLVCTLLFSAFCLMVSAEEEPTFVFHVNGVNGQISGEDAYIFTTQEAYENGRPNWAITILLEVQANGLLKVQRDGFNGGGSIPSVSIGDGVVALVVHSSSSDVGQIGQYPNVEEKLAALATKEGMYIKLDGIDLKAGTGSGTASLYATAPSVVPSDDSSDEPSDEPSSEAPASEEPSSEAVEASSEDSPAAEEASSQAAASTEPSSQAPADTSSVISDVSTQPAESSNTMTIVIIVVAAVVLVAAVVVIVIKRKK